MHQRSWRCYTPHAEHTLFILQIAVVCLIRQIYHEQKLHFSQNRSCFSHCVHDGSYICLSVDNYIVLFRGSRMSKKKGNDVFIWNIFQRSAASHLWYKRHSRGDVWVNVTRPSNRPAQHKLTVISNYNIHFFFFNQNYVRTLSNVHFFDKYVGCW